MNEATVAQLGEEMQESVQMARQQREAEFEAVKRAGTNLPELIERLCPDGVEFMPLGKLGRRHKGTPITAAQMKEIATDNGELTIYAGGKTQVLAEITSVPEKDVVNTTAIVVKSRGFIDFVHAQPPFTHKNELWSYSLDKSQCSERFVYYYLLTQKGKLQKKAQATSVKMPQLSVGDTDSFLIPLPPVEVQEEIVRILDMMTELEAELEAELEKRRLQYAHYRDALLSFNSLTNFEREREREREPLSDQWRWATLGEISTLVKQRCNAESLSSENYTGMENLLPDMKGRVNAASIPAGTVTEVFPNDILVGNIRPYLKKIWFANRLGGASPDVLVLRVRT